MRKFIFTIIAALIFVIAVPGVAQKYEVKPVDFNEIK